MRIYSMTATFGKLDHETLTLEPGLNILEAPNEWGKSTWCAFLTAMLYGLDTRVKTTKTSLSDKEHFAPWSGKPMSGRVDLCWKGRDITIERTTRGRVPMGVFRAYETATGLDVPELNGTNCGQMLQGVERSVFLRSGFIRISDLPVTKDDALRRRLNALVTTGDESGRGDKLAAELRDLKNKIRYNRSGLLPQAQEEQGRLENTFQELSLLREQLESAGQQMERIREWSRQLENHRDTLSFASAQSQTEYLQESEQALKEAKEALDRCNALCEQHPDRETAQEAYAQLQHLQLEYQRLELALAELMEPEEPEDLPEIFVEMTPDEAISTARASRDLYWHLSERSWWRLILGILLTVVGAVTAYWVRIPGIACGCVGLALLILDLILDIRRRKRKRALEKHYGGQVGDLWVRSAERYAAQLHKYYNEWDDTEASRVQMEADMETLLTNMEEVTQGRGLDVCREEWQQILADWDTQQAAYKIWQQAEGHYNSLQALTRTAQPPKFQDTLDYSQEETEDLLAECRLEQQRLENRMGQLQGRMDAIGDPDQINQRLAQVSHRMRDLEQTYDALLLAQDTLAQATLDLQRRYAPRIAQRARELMAKLTQGRYDRLQLSNDLSLWSGAAQEDALRDVLWRSEGTVDQLYLALRLAVARELAPEMPLILDDALVRFDDTRMKAALEILDEEAAQKQVLLFTCHSREKQLWRRAEKSTV